MQRNLSVQYSMMITFDQVTKRYPGGFEALSQVNFSLDKGEMAYLTGHSGAGKSTLLKLIALLEWPTSGQLTVNGLKLNALKKSDVAAHRSQLGITFQSPNLLNDRQHIASAITHDSTKPLRIIADHGEHCHSRTILLSFSLIEIDQ